MSKKTYLSLAVLPIFACFGSVARWVKPAFKNPMGKFTVIAFVAISLSKFRAHSSRIMEPPRIPSPSFFARVSKRAIRPVVASAPGALPDLEFIDSELIGGIRIRIILVYVVARQELGERVLRLGGVREHVGHMRMCGGGTAAKEFPWRDVDFSEGFLVEVGLVRVVELVLMLITNSSTTHNEIFLKIKYGKRTNPKCTIKII